MEQRRTRTRINSTLVIRLVWTWKHTHMHSNVMISNVCPKLSYIIIEFLLICSEKKSIYAGNLVVYIADFIIIKCIL